MKQNIILSIAILIILASASCNKQDDLYTVGSASGTKLSDIITFSKITNLNLDADGESICTLTVKINSQADQNNKNITFTTSGGSFTNNDSIQIVKVNSNGYASVSVYSFSPKIINVKAAILTFSIDTSITFVDALPDDILLYASKYVADTSENVEITTKLFRNPGRGKTSNPIKVFYKLTSLDTSLNLVYPEFSFSNNQEASITLINPFQISGRFNLISKVLASNGDTLSKSIFIKIK